MTNNELPEWLVTQYKEIAAAAEAEGGSVVIDNMLGTVAVTVGDDEYYFQHSSAADLLDSVPENIAPEDYILALAQNW